MFKTFTVPQTIDINISSTEAPENISLYHASHVPYFDVTFEYNFDNSKYSEDDIKLFKQGLECFKRYERSKITATEVKYILLYLHKMYPVITFNYDRDILGKCCQSPKFKDKMDSYKIHIVDIKVSSSTTNGETRFNITKFVDSCEESTTFTSENEFFCELNRLLLQHQYFVMKCDTSELEKSVVLKNAEFLNKLYDITNTVTMIYYDVFGKKYHGTTLFYSANKVVIQEYCNDSEDKMLIEIRKGMDQLTDENKFSRTISRSETYDSLDMPVIRVEQNSVNDMI